MRLLQLNIWEGRLLRQILKLIEDTNPDILCLQEVFSSQAAVRVADTSFFSSLQEIQKVSGHEHVFFSPLFSVTFADIQVGFGNAIISKFPLSDTRTVFTHGVFEDPYVAATHTTNTRNLQLARVQLPDGRQFSLANHHAHWETERLGSEISVEKMKLVRAELDKMPAPLVFAGDLNVIAASSAMRVFDGFLEDLTASHHIDSTMSDLGKVNDVACDHILISPEIHVEAFGVRDDLVSDHKALVLDFSS